MDGPRSTQSGRKEPASGGALADTLRRAGVNADKNGANRTNPRSSLAPRRSSRQANGGDPSGWFHHLLYVVDDHPGGDGSDNDQ
jgi:hypothetical protein